MQVQNENEPKNEFLTYGYKKWGTETFVPPNMVINARVPCYNSRSIPWSNAIFKAFSAGLIKFIRNSNRNKKFFLTNAIEIVF